MFSLGEKTFTIPAGLVCAAILFQYNGEQLNRQTCTAPQSEPSPSADFVPSELCVGCRSRIPALRKLTRYHINH